MRIAGAGTVWRRRQARWPVGARSIFAILHFVPVSFMMLRIGFCAMSVEQDRSIIRLFNELRRLEKAGQPTARIRQQICEAMRARDAA